VSAGYGRPLRQCKGIFEVLPTLPSVESRLRTCVHDASEKRLKGQTARRLRKHLRKEVTLVVSALAQFPRMQGHRHKYRVAQKCHHMFISPDKCLKIFEHVQTRPVFQCVNEAARRTLEQRHRPAFAKGWMQAFTVGSHPLTLQVAEGGMPARPAVRRPDECEDWLTSPADVAQSGLLTAIAALHAGGRKHHVAQAAKKRSQARKHH
jgi:hypothetical protein